MKFNDFYVTIYKELKNKGFNITLTGVREQLLQHPYYPSMQSVADYFTDVNIPSTVVSINYSQLKLAVLEANVIVHVNEDDGDNLLWIKEINNTSVLYSNKKQDAVDAFNKKWSGVALLLQIQDEKDEKDEKDFIRNSQNEMNRRGFLNMLIGGLICLIIAYGIKCQEMVYIYSIILKLSGLVFSLFLVGMELGFNMPIAEKLCSISTKNGCERITNSRVSSITRNIKLADVGLIYFITILFYQFFGEIYFLAYIALLCIPVVLISVLYQAFVVKIFCPLCTGVMSILVLDILLYYLLEFYNINNGLHIYDLLMFFGIAIFVTGSWMTLKMYIQKKNDSEYYRYSYYRLLRNPERIHCLLNNLSENKLDKSKHEILFGDDNAKIVITEVMNPYCSPCGETLKKIVKLLDLYDYGLQVRIQFVTRKSEEEKNNIIISHLLAFAVQNDKKQTLEALLSWFRLMDYEIWSNMYSLNNTLIPDDELQAYLQFAKRHSIKYTPTLYINDKLMPEETQLADIRYYIEDVITVD